MRFHIRSLKLSASALVIVLVLPPLSTAFGQAPPTVTANPSELLLKLNQYQFDSLDSELSSYEAQAEREPASEINAMVAFAVFDAAGDPVIPVNVAGWMTAQPNSSSAALAKAINLIANGMRPDASPAYLKDAKKELDRALTLNRNFVIAHATRVKLARISRAPGELKAAETAALAAAPASFAVREQVMYAMRPRWGGSREAMQQFADASQSYAADNPMIRILNGWVALDTGDDLAAKKNWRGAIDSYSKALDLGGDYWIAYRHRANAEYSAGRWDDALRDATRANELFPDNAETLKLLAFATAKLHQPAASILWITNYFKFHMLTDPAVMALLQVEQQEWKASGSPEPGAAASALNAVAQPRPAPAEGGEAAQNQLAKAQEKFLNLENTLPTDPKERFYKLSAVAVAAVRANELDKAEGYANELLSEANRNRGDWNYGGAIFYGNLVNGLVALRRDNNLQLARDDLIAAGRTPGSPTLNSFGPNMMLAKEVLARGGQNTVLEYLDLCRKFWKTGGDRLNLWTDEIKNGKTPDFGANLIATDR